jgi:hypothetical protein
MAKTEKTLLVLSFKKGESIDAVDQIDYAMASTLRELLEYSEDELDSSAKVIRSFEIIVRKVKQ